ncbi:uncharacterized protein BCN122_II1102 [Burkholderia cenocepacia]|nr:uncharacterized protein BCN122_II1102 [Burkholderia cenocepacia]
MTPRRLACTRSARRCAHAAGSRPAGKPVACIVGANCYADSIDSIARRA